MTVYQETKSVTRPEEPFPGVPRWRMDIAPVGPHAPELTPEAERFLVHLTQKANGFFDGIARNMAPGERDEYFTVHTTKENAEQLVHKTAADVHEVTKDYSNVHLVFFPAGSIPIARLISDKGYPSHRMHVLDISGSTGTESGSAVVTGTIPRELLDPTHDIVIPEDIIDTVNTIFRFIQARGEFRDPTETHKNWLYTLGRRLKMAHANGNIYLSAYADFARAASEEHVSVLSVWSKNEQARRAIWIQAFGQPASSQTRIQQELLMCYPIMSLPPTLWALGGDYVMDTGVLWSRIIKKLPPALQKDPRVTQYIGPTVDDKTSEWLIRAVRIGPLAYFETKDQETNVIKFIAKHASRLLG
ncbi:MAG: hypothetical protein NT149_01060 [Candidatus Gottesmanbacteria bacterium]|nr:hypothetical protein [Candidatus Gottesmanbacteria bacterium]